MSSQQSSRSKPPALPGFEARPRRTRLVPAAVSARLTLILLLVTAPLAAICSESASGLEFGIRAAQDDGGNEVGFNQYELLLTKPTKWRWDFERTRLTVTLEGSLGMLKGGGDEGFLVSLGPGLVLDNQGGTLYGMIGISPTLLSKAHYGDEDLGGSFYFTSYVGVGLKFAESWRFGYRYSHMSNAGINSANPGLNLHALELRHAF
jgi:hypothetical protein